MYYWLGPCKKTSLFEREGERESFSLWACVCSCISLLSLLAYAPAKDRNSDHTVIQWSLFCLSFRIHSSVRFHLACVFQLILLPDVLYFVLAIENRRLWAQLQRWRRLNERGWFMHTMARHLHEIPINLSGRHLGLRTNFIWDCHGHGIYSGGWNIKEWCLNQPH